MPSHRHRVLDFEAAFSAPRMKDVWQRTVRAGMRGQILPDLHDYLDVHRNIDSHVRRIRSNIIAGTYRPYAPEVVRLEKRDGISRRLLIPTPADALVLQTLVEWFESRLLAAQPTRSAFYSRSHAVRGPEAIDDSFAYPWWILWPQFQERIWEFSSAHEYTVVADLANYFDTIPLAGLRNIIASLDVFEESLLDFLFYMLEAFVWRPYYMPNSGVGLPQIDFDAPRLLAHGFLFPIDRFLTNATHGEFVRWMDDIDFGVDSVSEARRILGELETLLNSYGLRLNAGKTRILPAEDAARHFWVQENRQVTVATNVLNSAQARGGDTSEVHAYLTERYRYFRDADKSGNWEKVQKRYFGLFGRLADSVMEPEVPSILRDRPGLRAAALKYLARLGYSPSRLEYLLAYLLEGHCTDDASLFGAVRAIVDWEVPVGSTPERLASVADHVVSACGRTVTSVAASMLLVAKYGTPLQRESFFDRTFDVWSKSQWASRQVAAATPLLQPTAQNRIRGAIIRGGLHEGVAVLAHLEQLKAEANLDAQLRAYVFHQPNPGWAYPFGKVILASVLMDGALAISERSSIRSFLHLIITDPAYRSILQLGEGPPPLPTTSRLTTAPTSATA